MNQAEYTLCQISPSAESLTSLAENPQYLTTLFDFIIKINQMDSISETIWLLARHTIEQLNFEDCVIYLLDDDKQTLRQVAAYGPKSPFHEELLNPSTTKIGEGVVGKAAQKRQTIIVKDTNLEPSYVVDDQHRLSEMSIPIIFKDRLLGVIDSEHSSADFFDQVSQCYVEILASIFATKLSLEKNITALENSIAELEESKNLTENYLEISNFTYNTHSEKELYTQLHKLVSKQVKAQSFFIVLYDKKVDHYSFPYVHHQYDGGSFDFSLSQKKVRDTLIAEVIKKEQSYLANFAELKLHFKNNRLIDQNHLPFSWLGIPFQINEHMVGAIALQSYEPEITFGEKDKQFLTFLGQHISNAIDRKFKEQKLHYQALHDQVTGLSNRALFMDRLAHAYSLSQRENSNDIAVIFIDLDDFKLINDKYGHQTGDKLLQYCAKQFQEQLRNTDTLARLGGDEFAIILEAIESKEKAVEIANRILLSVQKSTFINDQLINTTISMGLSIKDDSVTSAENLLKNADYAMYHAKKKGKNSFKVYEASLHKEVLYERQIIQELKQAIEEKQLTFYFQPIIDLKTQKVSGFEALMRWDHPEKGIISPDKFIHFAERSNLIQDIDRQLLKNIVKQLKTWQDISDQKTYISFNISAQRFTDSQLIKEVKSLIKKYQISPDSLVIEVTEHLLIKNIGKARHLFHQLKSLGVKISLDDFGTGYSSLSYLNQLPFDILKIDRTFVSNITKRTPDQPIINMIVALAKTMKIDLVAEGIETDLQLNSLLGMHCRYGQGYYFSKPLPEKKAEFIVRNPSLENLKTL